jgi:hypothetical protein
MSSYLDCMYQFSSEHEHDLMGYTVAELCVCVSIMSLGLQYEPVVDISHHFSGI